MLEWLMIFVVAFFVGRGVAEIAWRFREWRRRNG